MDITNYPRFEIQNAIELPSLAANDSQSSPPAQESSSMITPQPLGQKSLFREDEIEHGKPSVIHSYCQRAFDHGRKECIWLCIQRGRKWIAKDIRLETEDKAFGISELRRISGWCKQHSMFSTVAVKEIRIRFLGINEATNEVEVVPMDLNYTSKARDFDHALNKAYNEDLERGECGLDVMGQSHDPNEICVNEAYNTDISEFYCEVQHVRDLEQQKEAYEWLPSMLDYYWQNGLGSKGVKFLKTTGFINPYEDLQYDRFQDAANPYGKTINAFKPIEGWHLRYLLCLFAAGMLCSICVVAIVTAVNQSFEPGLTAGSYALALAGVFLAILSFLSAVL